MPNTPSLEIDHKVEERTNFVYILAGKSDETLFIGVTNDIYGRTQQHRYRIGSRLTKKYDVHMLIWFETYGDIEKAIQHEEPLKRWQR